MIEDTEETLGTDDLDDDDDDAGSDEPAPSPKRAAASNKESEKKKRELITIGKAKGFLTYDEINDHMPENIVSSDQIDDWLSTLGGRGHRGGRLRHPGQGQREARRRARRRKSPKPATADEKEEAGEEEEEDGYSKTNDPVRMYLRKMGSVSLLTREGEVEIAKRIEDGERRVLQVVLNCAVAIEEILDLGDKLRKQKVRVKDVVKDADEEDAEFDEQWHIERVCKVIDKVRRLLQGGGEGRREDRRPGLLGGRRASGPRTSSTASRTRCSRRCRSCASTRSRSTGSSLGSSPT